MAFIDLSDEKNRITAVQRMLRSIALAEKLPNPIPVTGVFDKTTEEALKTFQRQSGLPQSGEYNIDTWNALKKKYLEIVNELESPIGITPYPNIVGYTLSSGERSELVCITQIMLNSLRLYYNIPYVIQSGVYDTQTKDAVKIFQRSCGMECSGCVDCGTWNKLAEEYNLTVNDSQ